MYLTLSQIKYKVDKLAKIIEAPRDTLPTFEHSEQSGRPHIEVDSRGYHYVIAERGHEFERHTTSDLDELLYDVFESTTFEIACKYEVEHRNFEQDFRRILFKYQEELLSKLSPAWGERRIMEHAEILQQSPFKDEFDPVSAYAKELKDQGFPSDVSLKMIMEKYPPTKRE
jgi:hypothetical protein